MLLVLIEIAGPALPAEDTAGGCREEAGAITVCARRSGRSPYRLPSTAEEASPPDGPPRAEVALPGGARFGMTTERTGVGGVPSNRVMATVGIPIGGKRR